MNIRNVGYDGRCSFRVCFLAFLWICCLLIGILLASNDPSIFLLMRTAPTCHVSIVGLTVVLILPVSFSIVGLIFRKFVINYLILAVKAFLTGYLLYGLLSYYGSAGWLVRGLMLFSDSTINMVLLWLIFRHINGNRGTLAVDSTISVFLAVSIGITDYLFVSPFLCSLSG